MNAINLQIGLEEAFIAVKAKYKKECKDYGFLPMTSKYSAYEEYDDYIDEQIESGIGYFDHSDYLQQGSILEDHITVGMILFAMVVFCILLHLVSCVMGFIFGYVTRKFIVTGKQKVNVGNPNQFNINDRSNLGMISV